MSTPPSAVDGVEGPASDIATGIFHSSAIQPGTGNAVGWGRNEDGQLAIPDSANGAGGTADVIAASQHPGEFTAAGPRQAGVLKGRLGSD